MTALPFSLKKDMSSTGSSPGSCGADLTEALNRHFGFSSFRPLQRETIKHLLDGHNAFVLFPTGAGKSLCFTLTVGKLVQHHGISARHIISTNDPSINRLVHEDLASPQPSTKLVYVTPETLSTDRFMKALGSLHARGLFSLLAVDEAHCKRKTKETAFHVPCVALTATATRKVQADILDQLKMPKARVFRASFDRPNIFYEVRFKEILADAHDDLSKAIDQATRREPGSSVIIYCQKRTETEELADSLTGMGWKSACYHAGLADTLRKQVQNDFMTSKITVVVSTVAFGMGLDKAAVRLVVHWNIPKSIESFYQESGRGGRDGKPSRSIIYFSRADVRSMQFVMSGGSGSSSSSAATAERAETHLRQFQDMVDLCQLSDGCRRFFLLRYFGEELTRGAQYDRKACCDWCLDRGETIVQKLQLLLASDSYDGERGSAAWKRGRQEGDDDDDEAWGTGKKGRATSGGQAKLRKADLLRRTEESSDDDDDEGGGIGCARLKSSRSQAPSHFAKLPQPAASYDLSVPKQQGMSDRERTLAILAKYRAAEEEEEEREAAAPKKWRPPTKTSRPAVLAGPSRGLKGPFGKLPAFQPPRQAAPKK